jgi:hypothetical protein
MNSSDIPAPMIPILSFDIRSIPSPDTFGGRMRVTSKCKWISFPVLRPEDLNTRNLVVADLSETPPASRATEEFRDRAAAGGDLRVLLRQIFASLI